MRVSNYEAIRLWVTQNLPQDGIVLDYGCGDGRLVVLLRTVGIEAHGCDQVGTSTSEFGHDAAVAHLRVMRDRIPLPDRSVEIVTANQVFEHVENLPHVCREIARVLRPGGRLLALFPDDRVWSEGHCGVPFVHWMRPGLVRTLYAYAVRCFGGGLHTAGKRRWQWAVDFDDWLARCTYYRPYAEICTAFHAAGFRLEHIEAEWMIRRFGDRQVLRALPASVQAWLVRRWAGLVIVATVG